MYRPQKLVAAFFSAALLCSTGIAFADKGGNHDKKGGSSHGATVPGQSNSGGDSKAAAQRGPGGIGGPRSAPGDFDRGMARNRTMGDTKGSEFEGTAGGSDTFGTGNKAGVHVKLANGSMHDFDISSAALNSLKGHQGRDDLIFFTNGSQQITAVCARGEKDNMLVTARTGDTFVLQDKNGQSRMITLDGKTANRLHVKVGSNLEVTATSATSGKVVALDLEKKHDFDKFSGRRGVEAAKLDVDRQKVDFDTQKLDSDRAKAKSKEDVDVAKVDMDRRDVDSDQVKLDIDKAKGNKADVDADQRKLDNDKKKCDRDIAKADFDTKKGKKSDVDVAKSDVDHHKVDNDVAKLDTDRRDVDNDQRKLDIDKAKGNKSDVDADQRKLDADKKKCDRDVAQIDVDTKGHKAKHDKDVDVADVDVKGGGGAGKCGHGHGSSRNGNPAFDNQMAKDAANDASGHNPPGLPHECVNPAGHTRGFCKSHGSSSSAMCGGGSSGGGTMPGDVSGGISANSVPPPVNGGHGTAPGTGGGTAPGTGGGTAPGNGGGTTVAPGPSIARGGTPPRNVGGGDRGPGAPVGMIPVAGGQFANGSGTRGSTRGAGRGASPTHVLGASTGPTNGRRIAALPTRVLPVAIQPVGKRRCVWYKTGVLGASTGPYRIIGTSAVRGKPVLHKKCR